MSLRWEPLPGLRCRQLARVALALGILLEASFPFSPSYSYCLHWSSGRKFGSCWRSSRSYCVVIQYVCCPQRTCCLGASRFLCMGSVIDLAVVMARIVVLRFAAGKASGRIASLCVGKGICHRKGNSLHSMTVKDSCYHDGTCYLGCMCPSTIRHTPRHPSCRSVRCFG